MTQKQVDAYYMNTGDDCPGMNSQYAGYQAYKDRVDNRPRPVAILQTHRTINRFLQMFLCNMQIGNHVFYASVAFNGARWYLGNESPASKSE